MKSKNLSIPAVNTGSMADIAFLLLIFFLVTTTILQDKGLSLLLPPKPEEITEVKIHDRNLFKILINSQNQYLINGKVRGDLVGLREEIERFVLNPANDNQLSESPEKAIVSLKANRGTEYKYFIEVLDEVKSAYYTMYGARVGLTSDEYLALDHSNPVQYDRYLKGKKDLPMNISIAQPDSK